MRTDSNRVTHSLKELGILGLVGLALFRSASASPFQDVPRQSWTYDFVDAALQTGLIPGYTEAVGPEEVLSRLELATLVSKLLGAGARGLAAGTLEAVDQARLEALRNEFGPELALLAQPGHEGYGAARNAQGRAPAKAPERRKKAAARPAAASLNPGKGMTVTDQETRKLTLGARFQVLHQADQFDDERLGGVAPRPDNHALRVRRAKLYSEMVLHPKTNFRLQFEAAGAGGRLDDAMLRWNMDPQVRLWLGQFKPPLSRESIQSTREILFIDRSLAATVFTFNNLTAGVPTSIGTLRGHGFGRSSGLQLWGDTARDPKQDGNLRWFFHIANGQGQNLGNENDGYATTFKLEFHPWGDPGYIQGSLDQPRGKRLALDVAWLRDDKSQLLDISGNGTVDAQDRQGREIAAFGYQLELDRFSSQGEYFQQDTDPDLPTLMPVESDGAYVQAGWLFDHKWEAAFRYGWVDPDRNVAGNEQREKVVGISRYIRGHFEKVQLDWARLTDELHKTFDEDRLRLQYQYTF